MSESFSSSLDESTTRTTLSAALLGVAFCKAFNSARCLLTATYERNRSEEGEKYVLSRCPLLFPRFRVVVMTVHPTGRLVAGLALEFILTMVLEFSLAIGRGAENFLVVFTREQLLSSFYVFTRPPQNTMKRSSSSNGSPPKKRSASDSPAWCGGGYPSLNAELQSVGFDLEPFSQQHPILDFPDTKSLWLGCQNVLQHFQTSLNEWIAACNARSDWTLFDKPPPPPVLTDAANQKWTVLVCHSPDQPEDQQQGWNVNKHIAITCSSCQTTVALVGNPTQSMYNHCFYCIAAQTANVVDLS